MQFTSFAQFMDMGGYSAYIWSSYALAIVVIVFNFIDPILRKRKLIHNIETRLRREQRQNEQQQNERLKGQQHDAST